MATPNVSATFTFVKRYPIVLCGFSLFFMPSVQRLLLYFTPLLLSTAIFIVAMMSWGPSASSERGKTRGKPKLGGDEWSFNSIDEEDEAEDEYMEEPQKGKSSKDMQQEHIISDKLSKYMQHDEISQKGKSSNDIQHEAKKNPSNAYKPDPDLKLETELEPDPDETNRVGTASDEAVSSQLGGQAEPDPDLQRDCAGTASNCASAVQHAGLDPDLHAGQNAEPNLHLQNFPAAQHEKIAPAAADHHLLPSSVHDHHHAEPAQLNDDQQAPAPQDDQHAEPHPDLHGQPAQLNHDQHDPTPQDDQHAEPDPDLLGESAGAHLQRRHAGSNEDVEGDLHAAVSELRPHDMELAKAAVERLEASLGISGSSFSHQPGPDRLQALHAAA